MGTFEGWPDMMYAAIDGNGDVSLINRLSDRLSLLQGEGPTKNGNPLVGVFYIGFIMVGSFFFLNLFIGAICFNFDQAHKNEKSCMHSFLTDEQRK